jgi:hypothetical protein
MTPLHSCKVWLHTQVTNFLKANPNSYVGQRVSLQQGHMLVSIRDTTTNKTLAIFSYEATECKNLLNQLIS